MLLQIKINKFLAICLLMVSTVANGQIEINKSIRNIPGDTLSIKNVGTASDSAQLSNLEYLRNNTPVFLNGTLVNDTLTVSYDSSLYRIQTGLVLFILPNAGNTNLVVLKINGHNFRLLNNNHYNLGAGDIISNKIMLVSYNGTEFVYLNAERSTCPTGYIKVNEKYCIQKSERQGSFWTAMSTCTGEGARLCSWSEWYYACQQRATLGVLGMTNANWEWIGQSQNEVYQGKAVGRTKCDITIHRDAVLLDYYRCCFDY